MRCPNLLPGGRPVADASAREQTAAAWNVDDLPTRRAATPRRILAAAAAGELGALLIGGVELADLPDPDAALAAVDAAPFVVSLELRESAVTDLADVVFPVAPVVEKAGSFVNWEGRIRPFEPSLPTNATPDLRVLHFLADEIGVDLALPNAAAAGDELARLGLVGRHAARAHRDVAGAARARPAPDRRCSRLADAARTRGGCRTANPTSPEPPARPSRGCRRPPPPRSVPPKAIWSPSAPSAVRSRCRSRSPTCRDRVVWLPLNSPGSAVTSTTRCDRGRRGVDRAGRQ